MSILEQAKKHQPTVNIQNEKIIISIGNEILHPMTDKHFINTITILKKISSNKFKKVKEFHLTPKNEPIVEIVKSQLGRGVFRVQARCNIHGTWEEDFEIS